MTILKLLVISVISTSRRNSPATSSTLHLLGVQPLLGANEAEPAAVPLAQATRHVTHALKLAGGRS